jgi:hypothetical protein
MQIPVLIEPIGANNFRARCGEPLPLTVEGSTADEAAQKLKEMLHSKLQNGAALTVLEIDPTCNPWSRVAGMYANNPRYDEWQNLVAENRRKADEAEGVIQ